MSEWERDAQYRPGDVVNGYVLAADGSWKPIGNPAPQQPVEPRNGLAIASVICGIVGMLSGLVPLFWWFAAALGVTALVLGLAGRGRVRRGVATNGALAWAGIVTGSLAIVLAVWGAVIFFDGLNDVDDDLSDIGSQHAMLLHGR